MIIEVKGEGLQQIALKYQTTVEHIRSINHIQSVREGMRLWLDGTITHVVGPNETLESIAAKWGVRVQTIEKGNAAPVRIGQVLTFSI